MHLLSPPKLFFLWVSVLSALPATNAQKSEIFDLLEGFGYSFTFEFTEGHFGICYRSVIKAWEKISGDEKLDFEDIFELVYLFTEAYDNCPKAVSSGLEHVGYISHIISNVNLNVLYNAIGNTPIIVEEFSNLLNEPEEEKNTYYNQGCYMGRIIYYVVNVFDYTERLPFINGSTPHTLTNYWEMLFWGVVEGIIDYKYNSTVGIFYSLGQCSIEIYQIINIHPDSLLIIDALSDCLLDPIFNWKLYWTKLTAMAREITSDYAYIWKIALRNYGRLLRDLERALAGLVLQGDSYLGGSALADLLMTILFSNYSTL